MHLASELLCACLSIGEGILVERADYVLQMFLAVVCFAFVLLFAPKVAGPDLVSRMGKLGAVAAVQPSFVPSDADVVIKRLR